jgi:hypothetical protein
MIAGGISMLGFAGYLLLDFLFAIYCIVIGIVIPTAIFSISIGVFCFQFSAKSYQVETNELKILYSFYRGEMKGSITKLTPNGDLAL